MSKSANEIVQEALFSSLIEAVTALKAGGTPNTILRDLSAIHANTSMDSLPDGVQKALQAGVRDTMARLQKEGYVIAPKVLPAKRETFAPRHPRR
jgi:hypothetical protein